MPYPRRSLRWLPAAIVLLLAPAALGAAEDCLSCHESADNVGDAALVVSPDAWQATVHGAAGVACADCHAGHEQYPHQASDPRAACATCHQDVAESLAASVHGRPDAPGLKHPGCTSCHDGVHKMVPTDDPASTVSPARLPATCGTCHADPELGAKEGIRFVQPIAAYEASVHARGVAQGEKAATCSSCHGSHDILPASDPRSRVNRERVPSTCAQCHADIAKTYAASVHGEAAARGITESPVCTDCHGEHRILGPADKGSPVYATNVPKMTCGRCHGDLRLSQKFGIKGNAVTAYEDSFHGLASRSGSVTVANCASCHGVHDILPSSDPRSHVAPDNLAKTCGNCHPGAGKTFAIGAVHVIPDKEAEVFPVVYWVREAYLWLIWVTIGGMALHNLLDLRRKTLSPITRPVVPRAARRRRMSFGFRVAHFALIASFLTLVWTGFALKYSESWWAKPLLTWEGQYGVRGWIHRVAAIVMLAAFAFHAVHLAASRRARACIRNMAPTLHDVHELREKVMWFLGKRAEMPQSPPLGYAEKAEYLALIWGTIVMAVTGFMLWFENWTLANLPKWAADVATVVHFYEAILASLAILVWHFYFVIFDPLVYPLDTTFLHGREAPGRMLERTQAVYEPKEETKKQA
jgi:cytochrome b subunit of formate dehydrogenase